MEVKVPCGVCGERSVLREGYAGDRAWIVECTVCGARSRSFDTGEEALNDWTVGEPMPAHPAFRRSWYHSPTDMDVLLAAAIARAETAEEEAARWAQKCEDGWTHPNDVVGHVHALEHEIERLNADLEEAKARAAKPIGPCQAAGALADALPVDPEFEKKVDEMLYQSRVGRKSTPIRTKEETRLRDALQHIADGNCSPSITFARFILAGHTAEEWNDQDGPGEEDGPWAEGWAERSSPVRTTRNEAVQAIANMVEAHGNAETIFGWLEARNLINPDSMI